MATAANDGIGLRFQINRTSARIVDRIQLCNQGLAVVVDPLLYLFFELAIGIRQAKELHVFPHG